MAIDYMIDAVTVIFIRVRGRMQRVRIWFMHLPSDHDIPNTEISDITIYPENTREGNASK